ncbi:hypothetical protein BGZ60DRAFT_432597 [Tricladium varicosporioides]|nr:hypothetical protein BGZ60DRAFT_432597 [Hymenoscyphus varicosporioides]
MSTGQENVGRPYDDGEAIAFYGAALRMYALCFCHPSPAIKLLIRVRFLDHHKNQIRTTSKQANTDSIKVNRELNEVQQHLQQLAFLYYHLFLPGNLEIIAFVASNIAPTLSTKISAFFPQLGISHPKVSVPQIPGFALLHLQHLPHFQTNFYTSTFPQFGISHHAAQRRIKTLGSGPTRR